MTDTTNPTTAGSEKQDATFNYRLLSRLEQDCEYYLGHGNRSKTHLWALDETEQIKKMKELYEGFSEKPEWISLEDIERYEAAMNPVPGATKPAVASFVYRDWNVTIHEFTAQSYEWFAEKEGAVHRDPTTHTSVDGAEKHGKLAVDSIIQHESELARRRRKN